MSKKATASRKRKLSTRADSPVSRILPRYKEIRIRDADDPDDVFKSTYIGKVPIDILVEYSVRAKTMSIFNPSFSVFLLDSDVDVLAAKRVVAWLWEYDFAKRHDMEPEPLRPVPKADDAVFPYCVQLLHASYAFTMLDPLRGQELQSVIRQYVMMAPLRLDEFVMIAEYLPTDYSLIQHAIEYVKIFEAEAEMGVGAGVPESGLVEEYVRGMGLESWEVDEEEEWDGWKEC